MVRPLKWLDTIANAKIHEHNRICPKRTTDKRTKIFKTFTTNKRSTARYRKNERPPKTSLISIDANKYSVPAQFARKTVQYLRYEDRIEILDDRNVIAIHQLARGKNQTIINDEPLSLT